MTKLFIGDLFELITRLILIMNIMVNQVRTRKLIVLIEGCIDLFSSLKICHVNEE